MTNSLIEISLQIGVMILVALTLALFSRKSFYLKWLIVAVLLIALQDVLLLRGYGLVPSFFSDSNWNWTGKLLATFGLLGIASFPCFGLRNTGVKLQQMEGSISAWSVFGILMVAIFTAAVYFGEGRDSTDRIFFQWTMPGIEEELFYRGVLLLAFNKAFPARKMVLGAGIGWGGILSTVAFGLTHSLFYGAEGVTFNFIAFALTGPPAILLLWFREKTGSILLPVIAHNVVNGAFTLF